MPTLALTFDDGPDPVWTSKLLDLLQTLDARATFFRSPPERVAHPAIIERMPAEERAVGLHCDQHVRSFAPGPGRWLTRAAA